METISKFLLTFLLNAIWQIPLITMIGFICDWLLSKVSSHIRHTLWLVTLILCVSLPIFSVFDSSNYALAEKEKVQKTNIQTTSDFDSTTEPAEKPQINTDSTLSINKTLSVFLIGSYFLLLGYFVVKLFKAWEQTQAIQDKRFLTKPSAEVWGIVRECQAFIGAKKAQVFYSSKIVSPVTVGAFNPLIILPESLADETDRNILLSAIGHELVHVKRCDYLLNLLCEIIYLPISFHPATMILKRRIRETRELRCDELVTDKLLSPTIYAQSLVSLAGSAIGFGRTPTMTIGVNDANILENRIIKILKRPKVSIYQKNLLLVLTPLFLGAAFFTAKSFSVNPSIEPTITEIEPNKTVEVVEKEVSDDKTDLSKQAKISMLQAIEIATKKQPGTIIETEFGENDEGLIYKILIRDKDASQGNVTRLTINALDGQVIKIWHGTPK